jgi:hypothetical protein
MLSLAGSNSTAEVAPGLCQRHAVLAALKGAERRYAVACGHP